MMRVLSWLVASSLFAAVAIGSLAIERLPAIADDMEMATCPGFTSIKWDSPMQPPESGTQYELTVTQKAMSCAQAATWAKKLIAQHIEGKPGLPSYPPLTGGPAGYVCKGSPDRNGHAWRGNCLKQGGSVFAPGFTWSNHATL